MDDGFQEELAAVASAAEEELVLAAAEELVLVEAEAEVLVLVPAVHRHQSHRCFRGREGRC